MNEYIDKKAADNALTAAAVADSDKKRRTWAKAIGVLHDIPAADVAPVVHGKWIEVTRSVYYGMDKQGNPIYRDRSVYYCSECNRKTVIKEKYCPDCGAKMDLED